MNQLIQARAVFEFYSDTALLSSLDALDIRNVLANETVANTKGKRRRAITEWLEYTEFKSVLEAICTSIDSTGHTDDKCKVIIEFRVMEGPMNITYKIDHHKALFNFDKALIQDSFGSNIGITFPYFKVNISSADSSLLNWCQTADTVFDMSKSYSPGIILFRGIGGSGYQSKIKSIEDILKNIVLCIKQGMSMISVTAKNQSSKEIEKTIKRCSDFATFKKAFPEIILTSDLKERTVFGMFPKMAPLLVNLLIGCNFSRLTSNQPIHINYDTSRGFLQLKDALVDVNYIDHVDFVDCKIMSGTIHTCQIYRSEIGSSSISNSFFNESSLSKCYLSNCYLSDTTKAMNCRIDGEASYVNGTIESSSVTTKKIGPQSNLYKKK